MDLLRHMGTRRHVMRTTLRYPYTLALSVLADWRSGVVLFPQRDTVDVSANFDDLTWHTVDICFHPI